MNKITVLLGKPDFVRFDAYCEERGYKKSTLIARLIRDYLEAEGYPDQGSLEFSDRTPKHPKRAVAKL